MINLVATTDKLQLVTSAAASVDVHVSYVDRTTDGVTIAAGKRNTAITTAATTDILAAPAASTARNAKSIHVRNKDACGVGADVEDSDRRKETLGQLQRCRPVVGHAGREPFVPEHQRHHVRAILVVGDHENAHLIA